MSEIRLAIVGLGIAPARWCRGLITTETEESKDSFRRKSAVTESRI